MINASPNPQPKQAALKAIEHLKDSASYEEMMYELYVLQKIERGREALRTGRTVSHEEARERLGKWLK
jgi:predicted transcriptional regulator